MNESEKAGGMKHVYKPEILSPRIQKEKQRIEFLLHQPGVFIVDEIGRQLDELIKIDHPSNQLVEADFGRIRLRYLDGEPIEDCGNWVWYPWRNTLVHLLSEPEFVRLRTSRNQFKITPEEQSMLAQKKIGVIGLSVGQSVALSLAMERAFGELRIADFDTLDLSNLNRIRTGLYNLGLKKTYIVAREIAEIDPYLKITLYNEGINEQNMHDFFTLGGQLDILVEECDSLPIKISSRLKSKALRIPVLMDTSDRGMMDVERFDMEPDRPILHGLLAAFGDETELTRILAANAKDIMMALLQFEQLSDRAKYSFSEIGKSITTWPQLASSVLMGGAACSHLCRMILLGQRVSSGRYYLDLESLFNSHEGKS
ncbi:putative MOLYBDOPTERIN BIOSYNTHESIS PROTEIN MOEY [Lunatimonas lonarensis]|uniref:Putative MOLYBDOPTERIN BIOSYNTHESIS PROTEIN MOEY n=1 Tax=Lunatimonas lonarensis TaxID=1232681 RepID=R7ZQF0_9BACT|nr:ThiF family adenylyltransferase [Lunatimonas lonarensis]EON76239.1 putative MOLYBDOPTERIN BIOSYNTHESIS PROTEIN MOEY [Lunatimonas lonarensis]